jgi:hypothetical protein
MAICQVSVNPNAKQYHILPVSGAGSSIAAGALMMPGATSDTNEGVAIPFTASSNARALGVLVEPHNYAFSGDATQATLVQWFQVGAGLGSSYAPGGSVTPGNPYPSRRIELFDTAIMIRVDYAAGAVAVASATTTDWTITSETQGQGGSFAYVNGGVGVGQLAFIWKTSSGHMFPVTALTTTLTSTSTLTKILRHFYQTPIWKVSSATAPTTLDSVAGDGTGKACVLGSFIQRNNMEDRLDPKIFHNMQSLNGLAVLNFYSLLQVTDTAFHPIS